MLKIAQLQQERALKTKAQENLVKARKEGDGKFTDEQRTQFATLQTEIEALDADIAEERQIEDFEKRAAAQKGERKGGAKPKGEEAEKREITERASITKAFRSKGILEGAEKNLIKLESRPIELQE